MEDCDMKFDLNTFKYGLPRDSNGIYNSLTKIPPLLLMNYFQE